MQPEANSSFAHYSNTRRLLLLFVVSVLGLFLELMLIRWVTTEIRIFAYLQNTVLVVCFLGLGMGAWTCRQPIEITKMLAALALMVFLLCWNQSQIFLSYLTLVFSSFQDFLIWESAVIADPMQAVSQFIIASVITLALLFVLWTIFVPIGRLLGRLLEDSPSPIVAYSVNVLGSLIGILLFVGMSAFWLPPIAWVATAALLLLVCINWRAPAHLGLLAIVCAAAALGEFRPSLARDIDTPGWRFDSKEIIWSPYQKLHLFEVKPDDESKPSPKRYSLFVNSAVYMDFIDLRPETVAAHPEWFDPELRGLSQYDLPCLLKRKPKKMLVVGAGGGNDVAGGLRQGAESIIGVEIDPAIMELGRRYHPEQPYSSPKVRMVNDDARAYFANCDDKFDLIVFGLLDSHTTTSMTNARLDHYVYTLESLAQAKRLLAPGGLIVLSFEANKPYIIDRMAAALRQTFDQEPWHFRVPFSSYGYGGVVFVVGNLEEAEQALAAQPKLKELVEKWQTNRPYELTGTTPVCTDDWPYLYLEHPTVPQLFYVLIALLAVLFLVGLWRLRTPGLFARWQRDHWHFFFLGAAFMLLEVQNISKAAVVLGSTWEVNAVMIGSILTLILLANLVVALFPKLPLGPVYVALLACCVGLYFVDLATFAFLPYGLRAVVVGGLASLPMLFSGIVFIHSFAAVEGKDTALGANLFGALVGGMLQTISFLLGIKALLLIVAGLYFIAFLLRPRLKQAPATPIPAPSAVAPTPA